MNGKTVMVTGASSGIGKATARELAVMGAHVVLVCREGPKADAALRELQGVAGNDRVEMLTADLSWQSSIREMVAQFRKTHDRLDVLVNNAGMLFSKRELSFDGLERTFALNHMGYFLLTDLLLDVLRASAPARIVNVSSEAHRMVKGIDFDDLQAAKAYRPWRVYGQSKLANILFTRELARRLEGSGVTANCLHPGFVDSGFGRDITGIQRFGMAILRHTVMISSRQGALTAIHLASSPQVQDISGRYFVKRRTVSPSNGARDDAAARRLWEASERLIIPVTEPSGT